MCLWKEKQDNGKRNLRTLTIRQKTSRRTTSKPSLPSFSKMKTTSLNWWKNSAMRALLRQERAKLWRAWWPSWGKRRNWRNTLFRGWRTCGRTLRLARRWGSSHASSCGSGRWGTSLDRRLRKRCLTSGIATSSSGPFRILRTSRVSND